MTITNLLSEQTILIPLDATDKKAAIEALAGALAESGTVTDKAAYIEALHVREQTGSTGIGFGVAIPHGKSAGVAKPGLAFAKFSSPVDWQSLDGEPVHVAFMIAVPEEAAGNEHLKILIAISRKLIDEEFRNSLMAVNSSAELLELLGTI